MCLNIEVEKKKKKKNGIKNTHKKIYFFFLGSAGKVAGVGRPEAVELQVAESGSNP